MPSLFSFLHACPAGFFRILQGYYTIFFAECKYIIENFSIDLSNVDVIIGYRADDSYFAFARDFIRNSITVSQLSKAMELGKLGLQVVLHSEKAFSQLKYIESTIADNETYYTKRVARDLQAREEYQNTTRNTKVEKDDLFIMDIIRHNSFMDCRFNLHNYI